MKQTAVEWLIDKIYFTRVEVNRELLDQAIEMEKQQIENAFENGDRNNDIECLNAYCNGTFETINAEQYYNETFNK